MYFQIGRITKLSLNFNIFSSLRRVLTDDKFVFRSDEKLKFSLDFGIFSLQPMC